MHQLSRSLATLTGLAISASVAAAVPLISVGPGTIYTAASGTNNILAGSPDTGGSGVAPRFNGVAFANGSLYLSDAAKHQVFRLVLATGQVTAFAGNGTSGNTGDNGAALSAQLNEPSGIAVDPAGNVYVSDTTANVVRRVDTSGNITTVAGNGTAGTPGYSGDGPATGVTLNHPIGLAVDASNNLLIADSLHGRILRLTSGNITTIAGNGSGGPFTDGPATQIALRAPAAVAIDPTTNDVYFSETLGHIVRHITGGNAVTIAGQSGSAGYTGNGGAGTSAALNIPYGLSFDSGGGLYLAESANQVVRKITTDANRTINLFAGANSAGYSGDGGTATTANINGPTLVTVDRGSGTVYFVDSGNNAIRAVTGTASSISFGVNQATTLTISNVGDATLSAAAVSTSTSAYSVTGGSCTSSVTLPPGQSCTLTVQSSGTASGLLTIGSSTTFLAVANGLRFVPITPCRVVDTRLSGAQYGAFGAPSLGTAGRRDFDISNSTTVGCSSNPVPAGTAVQAYSLNVTAVPKGPVQYVTVFPSGVGAAAANIPFVSTLNSFDGRVKANAAIVPVVNGNASVGVFATDPTDVIMDMNGYYVLASANVSAAQSYYPLPPCRVYDTRRAGVGFLAGGNPLAPGTAPPNASVRSIDVRGSGCNVPNSATAYSVNVTALPRKGLLNYLTVWPSDQSIPYTSTLNSLTGTVTANAAIVPASAANGNISAYATEDTEMIVDINGYYAPPSASGLSLYSVSTPCRVYDSRRAGGPINLPAGTSTQQISGASCTTDAAGANAITLPSNAQSWVMNATVVPVAAPLIYTTNWATGAAQPLQSTLNAFDGAVTSNLAVVPTVNASISTYVQAPTAVVYDVFGYFAP